MKTFFMIILLLANLEARTLAEIALDQLCSKKIESNSCSCKNINLRVENRDVGEFSILNSYTGSFSSKTAKEAVLRSVGCEGHFDIDENDNLIPVNYKGYLFMRKVDSRWKLVSYRAFDLGDECFKTKVKSKDALLCKQNYDSMELSISRILLYTFSRNGTIYTKVIYSGSEQKDEDGRIKSWSFKDLDGDGKKDIKVITKESKVLTFVREGDDFVKKSVLQKRPTPTKQSRPKNPEPRPYSQRDDYPNNYGKDQERQGRGHHRRCVREDMFKEGSFSFKIPDGFCKLEDKLYKYKKGRAMLHIILKPYRGSLSRYYRDEVRRIHRAGIKIPYKVLRSKKGWFVVSYFNPQGRIVYEKMTLQGGHIFGYKLVYPKRLKSELDPLLIPMNRSLKYTPPRPRTHHPRGGEYGRGFGRFRCERIFRRCSFNCEGRGDECLYYCERRRDFCYQKTREMNRNRDFRY